MKGRENAMWVLSYSSMDDGVEARGMAYLSYMPVGREQVDTQRSCLAGGLEEAPGYGDVEGQEDGRREQRARGVYPSSTLAMAGWPEEAEGLQRFGRGETDFATVSKIN